MCKKDHTLAHAPTATNPPIATTSNTTTTSTFCVLDTSGLLHTTKGVMTYSDKEMVPFVVFKLPPGHAFDCLVSFRGTQSVADMKSDVYEVNPRFSECGSRDRETARMDTSIQFLMTDQGFSKEVLSCKSLAATGHSLGGATALRLAHMYGIRAFTFSAPGPCRKAQTLAASWLDGARAMAGSATIYIAGDRIPFAAPHFDKMCDGLGKEGGRRISRLDSGAHSVKMIWNMVRTKVKRHSLQKFAKRRWQDNCFLMGPDGNDMMKQMKFVSDEASPGFHHMINE